LFANEPGNSWPAAVTQQFSAVVNNTSDQTVTWSVTGGDSYGTIDANGVYTAPATVPNPAMVTVTATSAAAASPGTANITVEASTAIGTSQITVSATAAGGSAHGDTVTLTVQ
jgi:hypothetical protein